jgi:hypothetical protein
VLGKVDAVGAVYGNAARGVEEGGSAHWSTRAKAVYRTPT